MEGRPKPGVLARHTVTGLMRIDMQDKMINPLAEQFFTPGLDSIGVMFELETAGEGLGVDSALSVDMPGRTCRPTFDTAKFTVTGPKLATNHIALTAIAQKISGKSPVAIVLAPQDQVMFVRHFAKPANVVLRDHVGHRAAKIPEELVRRLGAINHPSSHHRKQTDGIVAITFFELSGKAIGPVLSTDFVAIDRDALEGRPFRRSHVFH